MIPILYNTNETAFTSNGLGRLADCTRCEVTEERNGMFEVEFDYPISGKMYDQIDIGTIILCTHDDTGDTQPFEIYMRTAPIDGLVTFNARHISYRLGMIPVAPFTASSITQAFANFPTRAMIACPFTFWTDKSSTGTFKVTTPQTIRSVLGGSQGSILDVYGGGEYEWDKWTVKLYQNRGNDTDVTIRYGKNLLDITHTLDAENLYNAIVPYWVKDDEVVYGAVTKGTGVTAATVSITKDFTSEFENKPTAAQLNARALTWLDANQPWIPKQNIKVDFVQLWQTEDYKNVAALQRVGLCDTVSVIYPELGVTAQGVKIIRVVYDVLRDRYSEMELGEARSSFADLIQDRTEALLADKPSVSMMQAAIDAATALIRGGLGGHVVINTNADGEPEEILIMDTDSVETAVKVWRWNLGGLGYSSTGVNGPYTTAITQNGEIVADFITTGFLSAARIKGDTLTLGGAQNASGVLEVYNASGTKIGVWDKDGVQINAGNIDLTGAADTDQLVTVKRTSGNTTRRSALSPYAVLSTNGSAGARLQNDGEVAAYDGDGNRSLVIPSNTGITAWEFTGFVSELSDGRQAVLNPFNLYFTDTSSNTTFSISGGDIYLYKSGACIYGVDSGGYTYGMIRDNGSNLWIGTERQAAHHHIGKTFISAGHDGSAGNPTIYVSVPNAANNDATNYAVYHEGNTFYTYTTQDTFSNTSPVRSWDTGYNISTYELVGLRTNDGISLLGDVHITNVQHYGSTIMITRDDENSYWDRYVVAVFARRT